MSHMNTVGYFEIQSSNPPRELAFYKAIFGWNFVKEEFAPIEYYRIETNTIYGGLLKRPAALPPEGTGTNAFVCSVQVENFDKISESILQYGGAVAMPKFAVPGRCWQGYFLDPDHNVFGVFQVDEKAGQRKEN
jgi:predicted enzyme related to lactoylglutathione lyase